MITDTCKCGAKFEVAYAKYASDQRKAHEVWLAAHAVCRNPPEKKRRFKFETEES